MAMPITKARKERIDVLNQDIDTKLSEIKSTYENSGFGFDAVAANGFSRSNLVQDLNNNVHGIAVPEESEIISLGNVNGYETVNAFPLKGNCKNGVKYADPNNPAEVYVENNSNTLVTDRADENLDIDRWTSRTIFKFKSENYGYDRCVYVIPIADLANGFIINSEKDTPHGNTLKNYPYPEEIIMTSQKTEKNFIHFINVQYTDSHYGHFNGRNYNLMIVKNRTRYGVLDESGNSFKEYTSVYANDIETELAYVDNGYLYLPVPSPAFGEEMLDTLWDCRVIWRRDIPDRNISINLEINSDSRDIYANWKDVVVESEGRFWDSICYGDGKFVAIGSTTNLTDDTICAYSTDCINWTVTTVSSNKRISSDICYGGGKFVAIGSGTTFAYSTDCINWTEITVSNTFNLWSSICYGGGKFVAICSGTTFAYSTNGIKWTEITVCNTEVLVWKTICYGDGKFVALSSNPNLFVYSTNGINWTEGTIGNIRKYWSSICYGDGKFVAISSGNDSNSSIIFAYSTDGINWTEYTIESAVRFWDSICYGDGKFVAIANYSPNKQFIFAYSTDGINWTEGSMSIYTTGWKSICYGDGKFVSVGAYHPFTYINSDEINRFDDVNSMQIIDDRIHLGFGNKDYIAYNRSSNLNLTGEYYDIVNSIIDGRCVITDDGTIKIAPLFNDSYNLIQPLQDDRFEYYWGVGCPNQIFKISDNNYLGFYYKYCDHIGDDYIDEVTQLYWGIFDSSMRTINPVPSDDSHIPEPYPCQYYSSEFMNTGKIIKVFRDNINEVTQKSSYLVFAQRGIYRFNFCMTGIDAIELTSIETILTLESKYNRYTLYDIERISDSEFYFIYDIECVKVDIIDKTMSHICSLANILFGRTCIADLGLGESNIQRYLYDSNQLIIPNNSYYDTALIESDSKIKYKYGIFKNEKYEPILHKLVEKFSFDKELMQPPSYWISREYTISTSYKYNDISYSDDRFIAKNPNRNTFAYSTDGINWMENEVIMSDNLNTTYSSICYGNGKYVASRYTDNIVYSTDGINWIEVSLDNFGGSWNDVCYGDGKFVVVGDAAGAIIAYSTDGINWTHASTGAANLSYIKYCDGKFMSIDDTNNLVYSDDGINWNWHEMDISIPVIYDMCYGDGKFVAIGWEDDQSTEPWGTTSFLTYSTDGSTWTTVYIDIGIEWDSICYGDGKFVVDKGYYSIDGINWMQTGTTSLNSICYGNDKFVGVNYNSSKSTLLIDF